MTVLIITRSADNECIDSVTKAIKARGGRAFRFDTDRLVARQNGGADQLSLTTEDQRIDLDEVSAIWYRRVRIGGKIPDTLDPQLRRASLGEAHATVKGLIASLDAFLMDPLPIIRRAGHKQFQLKVARELGLETPRTLITNDPEAVRRFADSCKGGMVTKMLSSFAIFDEQGSDNVVFTTPIKPADLEDLSGLDLCPMTFQESIPKTLELRVTIVGDRVFTTAIDSQVCERATHDWRREGRQLADQWNVYDLPTDIERRLLQLMDRFGLNYGAIDVIVAPDGRHVFLEVNPVGEFFWLELHPGFAISEAIADVLLGRAVRRVTQLHTTHAAEGTDPTVP